MDEAYLVGIREKLRRADEHLTTLNDEVAAHFAGEPHEYVTDADDEAGTDTVRVRITTPPPVRLSVICGGYIHCLRSVLDHLVCAHAPRITRRTSWPLYTDRDQFVARIVTPARKGEDRPLTGIDPESALFLYIQAPLARRICCACGSG